MTDIDTRAQLTERRLELLRRRLDERGLTATPTPVDDAPAMSEGQLRMWFVHAADPSRALLNVCLSYRITGAVDTDRLHEAVDAVAVRHPVLRTTYRTASADNGSTGMPVPTVHPDLRPGWAEHDLSELSERARRLRLEVLAQREFSAPFDLNAESPLRITVIRISATELVLLLVDSRGFHALLKHISIPRRLSSDSETRLFIPDRGVERQTIGGAFALLH